MKCPAFVTKEHLKWKDIRFVKCIRPTFEFDDGGKMLNNNRPHPHLQGFVVIIRAVSGFRPELSDVRFSELSKTAQTRVSVVACTRWVWK